MPFTEDELTIENIKRCCERHFAAQIGTSLVCDIHAGKQGPSCKTLEDIPDILNIFYGSSRPPYKPVHPKTYSATPHPPPHPIHASLRFASFTRPRSTSPRFASPRFTSPHHFLQVPFYKY